MSPGTRNQMVLLIQDESDCFVSHEERQHYFVKSTGEPETLRPAGDGDTEHRSVQCRN